MADGDIDVLARKVHAMVRSRDPKVDVGKLSANRPSRLTGHMAAKSGDVLMVRIPEFWRLTTRSVPERDPVERVAHHREIVAPRLGQRQPLALPRERPDAERCLERFDLLADRALRDVQFLGRAREALASGRALERRSVFNGGKRRIGAS